MRRDATTAHAFVNKMDTQEIELWYDGEKEKAFKEYLAKVEENKDKNNAEKEYKEKTKKLREKYIKLFEKSLKPGFFKKISMRIRLFMDKLAEIYKE
jgi:hypothetical protein